MASVSATPHGHPPYGATRADFFYRKVIITMMNAKLVAAELQRTAAKTRVFLSMPYIQGLTPQCMERPDLHAFTDSQGFERRDGIFKLHEAGLSPLDHGNLYGDAVFEGIRIDKRRILMLKEHVDRWIHSAQRLEIPFPYSRAQLCDILVQLTKAALDAKGTSGYLRPVLTRGMGNLGVNPAKCIAPSLYIVASSITLYPPERYQQGIDVTIARHIRRNDARFLDPNIKTNNYLNNVFALLETRHSGALETLMLTHDGYVAEATADNLFVAEHIEDKNILKVPAPQYALVGLTRQLVLNAAQKLGFHIIEDAHMLPTDLIGPTREVFITGTACGLMPVLSIDGLPTAPPDKRPLIQQLSQTMTSLALLEQNAFDIDSGNLEHYLL